MTRVGMGDIHTRTNIVTVIIIITKIQQIKTPMILITYSTEKDIATAPFCTLSYLRQS